MFYPDAGWLQFDRTLIAQGEWWRLITGHLAHWNGDQLFWNVLPFYVLGAMCETRDRQRFAWCLGVAAAVVPAAVWVWAPWLQYYRGLSGLDSAFFTLLGAMLLREKIGERRWGAALGIIALWVAFLAKVAFEASQGATLFVQNAGGMVPVAGAHLAGAAAGVAAYVVGGRRHGRGAKYARCEAAAM
jgi:rhomboid family GlyGly-CTERM serine protease